METCWLKNARQLPERTSSCAALSSQLGYGFEAGAVAWGDFNNDGYPDVVFAGESDAAPTAPAGLSVSLTTSGVTLGWNRSTDAERPINGLSYNVRITGPNGKPFVVSPGALSGGARLLAATGNAGAADGWSLGNLGLPTGVYTWGVQAIDSAFAGSAFSTNGTFQIDQPVFTSEGVLGDGRYQLQFTGSNLTYHFEATTDLLDCGLSRWIRLAACRT